MTLKRVGVLSAGLVAGIVYAGIGLVAGAFVAVLSLFGAGMEGSELGAAGALGGVAALVILPIVYGVIGFLGAMLAALLYNLAARITGGLELDLQ